MVAVCLNAAPVTAVIAPLWAGKEEPGLISEGNDPFVGDCCRKVIYEALSCAQDECFKEVMCK